MNSSQWCFTLFYALVILVELSFTGIVETMRKFPCYKRKYQLKRFYCKNEFFLSFRDKPFQSCSETVKEFTACRTAVDQECLMQADKSTFLYQIYRKISMSPDHKQLTRQYCHDAGLITPFINPKSMSKVGCTVDFYIGKATCIKDFQRKWRHNRSNKLLCDEFDTMNKCIDDETVSHCTVSAIAKINKHGKEVLAKLVSRLNPFCEQKKEEL